MTFQLFKPSIALGLGIIITTCSVVISSNAPEQFDNITSNCGDTVVLSCNIPNKPSEPVWYWYRLSLEKMKKMKSNNSLDQLSTYRVEKIHEIWDSSTVNISLSFISIYDTGWYSCLNVSEEEEEIVIRQTIRRIWLEVRCEDNKRQDHLKQHLEKINEGLAPPYILKKTIGITKDKRNRLLIKTHTRGYPEPHNITCRNHREEPKYFSHAWGIDYLEIPIDELRWAKTFTFFICNTNGCVNDTYHHIQVNGTRNHAITLEETLGQNIQLCCNSYLNSTTGKSQWFVQNGNQTKITNETKPLSWNSTCFPILNTTKRHQGSYECRIPHLKRTSIDTFYLKIFNELDPNDTTRMITPSPSEIAAITENIQTADNIDYEDDPNDSTRTITPSSVEIVKTTEDGSIMKILMTILIVTIIIAIISGAFFFWLNKREMRKTVTEIAEMTQQMKKVVVERQMNVYEGSPNALNMPVISIQYLKPSQVKGGVFSDGEYEMPIDKRWEYPRENLQLGDTLGEGEFGKVLEAQARDISRQGDETITTVAVKMLKDDHNDTDMIDLVSEMELMKLIGNHPHVLQLLGCCSERGPFFVITEYAENGNLKTFLRKYLQQSTKPSETTLISYAHQIAQGMDYLASLKCIHRDLAARNILVTGDYTMKIADFGLARNIRNTEYYKKTSDGRLPIKWMAPEALFHNKYTTQSDVWSFGILLWEIVTLGGNPYPSINNFTALHHALHQNYRMEKPPNTSTQVYNLMLDCWKSEPEDRPNFSTIAEHLLELLAYTEVIDESKHSENSNECESVPNVIYSTESDEYENATEFQYEPHSTEYYVDVI
ncbi:fibroblast growth factor receptor homolog 1-like isoform X1 [Planococcus citri]|uniref:fibroblast growth factor receptor homolog 1-like isoform X1 n=1 Tax=Planococcus citri TaxID=170843 RepID=UPI0031F80E6F